MAVNQAAFFAISVLLQTAEDGRKPRSELLMVSVRITQPGRAATFQRGSPEYHRAVVDHIVAS